MSEMKNKPGKSSWKSLLHMYRTTKIPWLMLLLVVLVSFGSQTIGVIAVKYSARIDTGDMTGAAFLIGYIVITIVSNFLENAYDLVQQIGGAQMGRNVRRRLWGKMLRLPVSAYEKEEPQRFVSRVTNDTEYAYGALTALIQILSIGYGVFIAMKQVVAIYAELSWIMLAIIPALIICSLIVGKIQYRMDRMITNAYSKVTNFYSERLPNLTYIKTNNMEDVEYQKGVEINNKKYKADVIYQMLFALNMPITSIASYLSTFFVLWTASAMVRAGSMEMVQLISLNAYFALVMENATLFLGIWQTIKRSHGGCEKIAEIDAAPVEDLGGEAEVRGQEDIVFDQVSFGYNEKKEVLKEASFTIPKGKITAIVGENGSGKSTIMRLLERFDVPASGKIRIGGKRLGEIDCAKWRDTLGYVFQGNQMIQGTVRENLTYGLRREYTEEELIQAAKAAGAYDFIMEKEDAFDTFINPFESGFSGGQLQRLAIARVLMKNPEYLIMDEATSGVDVLWEDKIISGITDKMRGKTVLVISHNMNLVKKADHVVVINGGEVEAEGSVAEVSERSDTFKLFLNADRTKTAG